jgi:integrase/recombinase XerD
MAINPQMKGKKGPSAVSRIEIYSPEAPSPASGRSELLAFKEHLQTDKKSQYTVRQYRIIAGLFLDWIKKKPGDVTAEDLEIYKRYLSLDKKYAKTSLYLSIKALQAFFRFLEMDVAEDLKPPKRGEPIPRYLSEGEMATLLKAAAEDDRNEAIILTLGYTGLRLGELCALNVEDVDFADDVITVKSGKGDKGRIVLMEERTKESLGQYLQARRATAGPLFVSTKGRRINYKAVERLIDKYSKKAGIIKRVTPHVLRHTLATSLLRRGADIRIIQQLLGHASVATTQIYTHVDDRALKDAYKRAKPQY